MIRPVFSIVAALLLSLAVCTTAQATSIKLYGDFRVQGTFFSNQNYTGESTDGSQTADTLDIWQRLRLHMDFAAGEHLAFRLGLRVQNQTWGTNYLTAANPVPAVQPYQCYLQLTVPDTAVTVTAGYQPLSLPHSSIFYDSVVLSTDSGNSDAAALVVSGPILADTLSATVGLSRLVDANRTYDTTTTQVGDEFDLAFASLSLTVPGLAVTPWGAVGVLGKDADLPSGMSQNMVSAGSFLTPTGYRNNQNAAVWTGATLTADALDPVRLSADVAYGNAGFADASRNRRQGWFADLALEYTGLTWVTPQLMGWYGAGEDASLANGSERLPYIVTTWGPTGSFLFSANQDLTNASMNTNPQGSMGLTLNFNAIGVLPKLTSLVAFSVAAGTNSPAGLRQAVAVSGGPGAYVSMGQDLAQGESALSVASEHTYALNEALKLVLETGWAKGQGFRKSIWGQHMADKAGDAWQGAVGLIYTF
jgi:hypothetical protein